MILKRKITMGVASVLIFATPFFIIAEEKNIHEPSASGTEIHNTILAVAGAELDISPAKVTKSVSWTMNFLSPTSLEQRKTNLINDLCKETGADIIVDPQFTYKRRILGGGKLTLTGYPAKYRNFRNLNETEIDSLIINKSQPENSIIFINTQEPEL